MANKTNTPPNNKQSKRPASKGRYRANVTLTILGLAGVVTGCNTAMAQTNTGAQQSAATPVPPPPASTSMPALPTNTPTTPPSPTATPWFSPTPLPVATPWPTPAAWNPAPFVPPALEPVPVVPTVSGFVDGVIPVGYSPPDGVDVFGNAILRWAYYGPLAEDEWFDIKIKPLGSENSVFVDWSKTPEYELRPWPGWTPGLYTWQIGIVKGYKEGDTKHFIADTGRDSQKFIIKWQASGPSNDGGGSSSGGGASGGGGGGGGGASGGS